MDKLKFFLENPIDKIEKEIKVSDRIPFKFKIRPMTNLEYSDMQKRCTRYDKKGATFDSGKFNSLVVQTCTVEPNFSDAEAIKTAGCTTPTEFASKVLLVGEISTIASEITTLSGFTGIDEDISEAKN